MKQFKDLLIKPFIQSALDQIGFQELTPVQAEVIPRALKNEDLIVQSQTGSGKTHSFLIPVIEKTDPKLTEIQAVITSPSRELAEQLYDVALQLASYSPEPIQIERCIGGSDKLRQIEKIKNGQQPHIVIGTPGRIFDLMSENVLWVQTTKVFIVDEADMTMDLGFLNLVDEIASRMPKELQMMVFSATIPQSLQVFLNKYMTGPSFVQMNNQELVAPTIDNYLIYTRGRKPFDLVHELLTLGQPYLALVFCNTKESVDHLAAFLQEKGLKVAKIHGDIETRERRRTMRQIRNLDYQYVVATDLAARGIDIPGISMVINLEMPTDLDYFVHRIGRTGRNNLTGEAFTLITPDNQGDIDLLEAKGITFEYRDIEKGVLVEATSRKQRQDRKLIHKSEADPTIKGLVKKVQRQKVKPGYKRKLKQQIREHQKSKNNRGSGR